MNLSSQSLRRVSCVSSRVSTSALACTPRQHPRLRQARAERSLALSSLDQRLVCQPLARGPVNEAIEPRQGMVLDVALVEPERKFVNVTVQVLRAGVMIDAYQAAFQDGKDAFDAVCRHVAADIFAGAVTDGFVVEAHAAQGAISGMFVGMKNRTCFDIRADFRADRLRIGVGNVLGPSSAASLTHAENGFLAGPASSSMKLLVLMHILGEAANVSFVDFDNALQHFELRSARFAETVQDKPSRFLRDPDFLGELHRRNALTRRDKQVHCINPLVQRNMRPLENRSSPNGEVLFALIAAIEAFLSGRDPLAKSADGATRAVRPKARFKIGARRLLIREHLEKLESGNRALGHRATPWLRTPYGIKLRGSQIYNSPN